MPLMFVKIQQPDVILTYSRHGIRFRRLKIAEKNCFVIRMGSFLFICAKLKDVHVCKHKYRKEKMYVVVTLCIHERKLLLCPLLQHILLVLFLLATAT